MHPLLRNLSVVVHNNLFLPELDKKLDSLRVNFLVALNTELNCVSELQFKPDSQMLKRMRVQSSNAVNEASKMYFKRKEEVYKN